MEEQVHEEEEELHSVWKAARVSAKTLTCRTIRATLHSTFMTVLKDSWILEEDEMNGSTKAIISRDCLERAEKACVLLGSRWAIELQGRNLVQVADWVNEMVAQKSFWEIDPKPDDEGTEEDRNDVSPAQPNAELTEKFRPEQEADVLSTRQNDNDNQADSVPPTASVDQADTVTATSPDQVIDRPVLHMKRIRDMGMEGGDVKNWIKELDTLGRKQQTFWPADWSLIEKAASRIEPRLHTFTKKPQSSGQKSILRRGKRKRDQNERNDITIEENKDDEEVGAPQAQKARTTRNKSVKSELEMVKERLTSTNDAPRRASRHDEVDVWDWEKEKTTIESDDQLVNRALHPETPEPISYSITGALKDVGRHHLFLQPPQQHHHDPQRTKNSDRVRSRQVRKAKRDRLGPHLVIQGDKEYHGHFTKVARTVDEAGRCWWDIDLGECMVLAWHLPLDTPADGGLMAFGSVECMLLDEDCGRDV